MTQEPTNLVGSVYSPEQVLMFGNWRFCRAERYCMKAFESYFATLSQSQKR